MRPAGEAEICTTNAAQSVRSSSRAETKVDSALANGPLKSAMALWMAVPRSNWPCIRFRDCSMRDLYE
jgi:hypothetical protein